MFAFPLIDIYCRTAVDGPEARTNLQYQENMCRAYCEAQGLSVGMVHHEIASGTVYRERELLSLLRVRCRQGSIQGVVVIRLDRISRVYVHLFLFMEELKAHDATLHCVTEHTEDTAVGKLAQFISGFLTDVEREKALDTPTTDSDC